MLPEGWIQRSIGDLGRVVTGNTPPTIRPGVSDDSVPFVTPGDLGHGRDVVKAERAVSIQDSGAARVIPAGSTLVTCIGSTIGKSGLAAVALATNQQINAVVPNEDVDSEFLYYQIEAATEFLKALAGTQAVPIINKSTFSSFQLVLPASKVEQRQIASILAAWDVAISVAGELCANWLEQVRLTRETLVTAALPHPRVPLGEVAEVRTGLAKGKSGQRDAIQVPYLRVANVQDGHLDLKEVKLIEVAAEQVGRYSLQAGDVLMTEGGDFDKLGRGTVWSGEIDPCLHQNHVFAVRPHPGSVQPGFIAALAASDYGRSYFLSCAKRSTNLASINSTQLKALPIPLVPMVEQARFVAVMETATKAARASEDVVDRLVQEKRALMAALLTGKRRVRLPAAEAAP